MKGLVLKEDGNMIKVHIKRKEACGQCKACLSGMTQKDMDLDAKNLCDAKVGDWVELNLQKNAFLYAVLISYGMPLLAFFVFLLIGYFLLSKYISFNTPLLSFICGLIGVLLTYAWIKSQNKRWERGHYTPLAVRLTSAEDESQSSCC